MNREVFELVSRHITFSKRPLDANFDLKVCYLSYGTQIIQKKTFNEHLKRHML